MPTREVNGYASAILVGKGYIQFMETIGQRIRLARENAGVSQQKLADALDINRVSVSNWENDESKPELQRLSKIAAELNTNVEWLLTATGPEPEKIERKRTRGQPVNLIPGDRLLGTGKMPVYAAAQGGDGHVIITFDPVDMVKRPAELENVKGGYGLLITGESMIPAFWPGDMALVNPLLAPARMKNVILYHTPPHGGDVEAIVKQLNNWTEQEWLLQQYNPQQEFREYRREWPICHRVVGRYDAR